MFPVSGAFNFDIFFLTDSLMLITNMYLSGFYSLILLKRIKLFKLYVDYVM